MPHAGRVLLRTAAPALALVATLLTGCSGDDGGDCAGQAYHPDLTEAGEESPMQALSTWLSGATGFEELPADDGWIFSDAGEADPDVVEVRHEEGDGWWVQVVRTDGGGYVVEQATDDWAACEEELS